MTISDVNFVRTKLKFIVKIVKYIFVRLAMILFMEATKSKLMMKKEGL